VDSSAGTEDRGEISCDWRVGPDNANLNESQRLTLAKTILASRISYTNHLKIPKFLFGSKSTEIANPVQITMKLPKAIGLLTITTFLSKEVGQRLIELIVGVEGNNVILLQEAYAFWGRPNLCDALNVSIEKKDHFRDWGLPTIKGYGKIPIQRANKLLIVFNHWKTGHF